MRLNNDSYNYRLPKLTLKRFNHTRQYSILINKLAAAKQLYSLEWNAVFNMTCVRESYTVQSQGQDQGA